MWRDLVGTWGYAAGDDGTVSLPAGATIVSIRAHSTAGGTVEIFGGTAIPVVATASLDLQFNHCLAAARIGALDIVFTGTDSYFVEYVKAGNT